MLLFLVPILMSTLQPFLLSQATGFILGGASGIGKTTLLSQKVIQWREEGHAVFCIEQAHFAIPISSDECFEIWGWVLGT